MRQKAALAATHTIAAVGGIRYAVVGLTPRCRAIELGRFGRGWEGLGSGQSPLQPVDAPLLPATRRVMPAAHAQCRCGFAAFCRHAQCCCNGRQCSQKLPNLLKISQNIPIKAAINRIVGLAPTTGGKHRPTSPTCPTAASTNTKKRSLIRESVFYQTCSIKLLTN